MTEAKPSKSAKKREVLARQALGEQLIGLTEEQLRGMDLDERLIDAITTAARIRSRGALRRQRQLIGKLMRDVDPERLHAALDALRSHDKKAKKLFRLAEEWRDRIVERGHPELEAFCRSTGKGNEDLSGLLTEYLAVRHEGRKRALRRKIFRLVHEDLAAAEVTIES